MPMQTFTVFDIMGPVAVSAAFIVLLFILSIVINFTLIRKEDERTIFEKFGSHFDLRCGVHQMRHRSRKPAVQSCCNQTASPGGLPLGDGKGEKARNMQLVNNSTNHESAELV